MAQRAKQTPNYLSVLTRSNFLNRAKRFHLQALSHMPRTQIQYAFTFLVFVPGTVLSMQHFRLGNEYSPWKVVFFLLCVSLTSDMAELADQGLTAGSPSADQGDV